MAAPARRLRICLYVHGAAAAFGGAQVTGGNEVLVRWLAPALAREHEVHVVGMEAPGARPQAPPGVRLHLVEPPPGGASGLGRAAFRSIAWSRRFVALLAGLRADVYVQRGLGGTTALVQRAARRAGGRFVFHWASDDDAAGQRLVPSAVTRAVAVRARRRADLQVLQSAGQAALLRRGDGPSVVIPDAIDPTVPWALAPPGKAGRVLWVATIKPEAKRPDRFLALAQRLPHRSLRMVGPLQGPAGFREEFRRRLAALPNVTWAGEVARSAMPQEYAAARCLVNVSDVEGVPLTFLEACASGVPVVSLNVDPDGLLGEQGCGVCLRGDEAALPAAVDGMFQDDRWMQARRGCAAATDRHSADRFVGAFLEAIA